MNPLPDHDRTKIHGVIFDLDGTLIDSWDAIEEAYRHAVAALGIPAMETKAFREKIGRPLEEFFAVSVPPDAVSRGVKLFRERYVQVYLAKTRLLDNAAEVVRTLHGRGVRLAVATNKFGKFARNLVAHLGVGKYFSAVLGAGDGIPPKPAPDILLRLVEELGLGRKGALYAGDTPMDIETGGRAGVPVVAVATGYYSAEELRARGPWRVIAALPDILEIVT